MIKRLGLGIAPVVLFSLLLGLSAPAHAQGISQKVAVCGLSWQNRCTTFQGDGTALVAQSYQEFSITPTVTASSAYSSGAAVGGLETFSNVIAVAPEGGRIEEVTLYSKSAQTGEVDFVWCGQNNPSSSTITDHTAVSVASADFNKCRTVAQLSTWQSFGTVSVADSGQLAIPFAITSGTTGYGFLIARSTPTYSSTSDLQLVVRIGH